MSLTGSLIGALVALVPAARSRLARTDEEEEVKANRTEIVIRSLHNEIERLNRSRRHLIDHIEIMQRSLDDERRVTALMADEARRLRIEAERLNQGAHRCQHQADLNRAMAEQQMQNLQAAQNMQALGTIQPTNEAACHRLLEDCGMHRAEMVNRLNAQR